MENSSEEKVVSEASKEEFEESNDLKSLGFPKSIISLVLGVFVVAIITFVAYSFLNSKGKQDSNISKQQTSFPKNNVSQTDPTASWKTYSDTNFKYSIKVPGNWNTYKRAIDGADYQIGIYPQDQQGAPITIASQSNEQNISAEDFVKTRFGGNYPIEKRKIGEKEAVFVKNDNGQYVSYFVNNDNYMYELAASTTNEEYIRTFDQILSTFQFTK